MKFRGTIALIILLIAFSAAAQPALRLPETSPAARVGETIGVTDVAIAYHRPAVNNRKIWGGLVPYGVLWRAGANENTTIVFSTPVKVEGQPLPAGTYGLFMIPAPSQWTVVLSKFASDWGAYNYDPAEDALRVTVTPSRRQTLERRCMGDRGAMGVAQRRSRYRSAVRESRPRSVGQHEHAAREGRCSGQEGRRERRRRAARTREAEFQRGGDDRLERV